MEWGALGHGLGTPTTDHELHSVDGKDGFDIDPGNSTIYKN